jgi:hypothetical protein
MLNHSWCKSSSWPFTNHKILLLPRPLRKGGKRRSLRLNDGGRQQPWPVVIAVLVQLTRRVAHGVFQWPSNRWDARRMDAFIWCFTSRFGNSCRRPSDATSCSRCSTQLLRISRPPGSHRGCLPPSPRANAGQRPEPRRQRQRLSRVPSSGQWPAPVPVCLCVLWAFWSSAQLSLPRLATEPLRPPAVPYWDRSIEIALSLLWLWCFVPTTSGPCLAPPELWNVVPRALSSCERRASGTTCFGSGRPHPHSLGPGHALEFRLYKTRSATCMLHDLCVSDEWWLLAVQTSKIAVQICYIFIFFSTGIKEMKLSGKIGRKGKCHFPFPQQDLAGSDCISESWSSTPRCTFLWNNYFRY